MAANFEGSKCLYKNLFAACLWHAQTTRRSRLPKVACLLYKCSRIWTVKPHSLWQLRPNQARYNSLQCAALQTTGDKSLFNPDWIVVAQKLD